MSDVKAPVTTLRGYTDLHKGDYDVIHLIVGMHLDRHTEFEENYTDGGGGNPYSIDREGLERALVNYCMNVRKAVADA